MPCLPWRWLLGHVHGVADEHPPGPGFQMALDDRVLTNAQVRRRREALPRLGQGSAHDPSVTVTIRVVTSVGVTPPAVLVAGDSVALGVLAEPGEVFVEAGQVEVEDVDAVAEVLEPELGPDSAQRPDGLFACCLAGFFLVWLADRCGVADGCPAAGRQLPDGGSGQEGAQAEAPPLRGKARGAEDQDAAAGGLEEAVELGIQVPAAAEDGLGDQAEVGVLAV